MRSQAGAWERANPLKEPAETAATCEFQQLPQIARFTCNLQTLLSSVEVRH